MMPTQTHSASPEVLERLIESSALLTGDRRKALRSRLRSLTSQQAEELQKLLSTEDVIIRDIARKAVERAVTENDAAFLQELDALLHRSLTKVRRAEEGGVRKEETDTIEHLFDEPS